MNIILCIKLTRRRTKRLLFGNLERDAHHRFVRRNVSNLEHFRIFNRTSQVTFSSGNDVSIGMSWRSKRVGVYSWEFSILPRLSIERVFETIEKLHRGSREVHDDVIECRSAWGHRCILCLLQCGHCRPVWFRYRRFL